MKYPHGFTRQNIRLKGQKLDRGHVEVLPCKARRHNEQHTGL